MYAVIETGSKQYRVSKGDVIQIEKLDGEKSDKITFEKVLMTGGRDEPKVGKPYLDGVKVEGEITKQGRSRKVLVYKKKRRKGYEKKRGHRQPYTEVKIDKVGA
ncbi:50S ribosomal protein L21 [bacterium]|nr:50S ribosomal protein L21 [bacterium]